MRVLLAGATGTLARSLVPHLKAAGHDVTGIVRSRGGAQAVGAMGVVPILADVLDREGLLRAVRGAQFDAVIHELTALKKAPVRHADMAQTNVLRTTGTQHLIEAAAQTGATKFVTQSIVFGYGYRDHGSTVLAEASPFGVPRGDAFDQHLAAMVSTEQQVLEQHRDWLHGVALRYGLFYGNDVDSVIRLLRKRALPIVRNGGEIPFIHHDDAAAATVAALENGGRGRVYNVVDDVPATFADLVLTIAERSGAPKPVVVPKWLLGLVVPYGRALFGGVSMRVSNTRAREELAWAPLHRSIREGLSAVGPG